MKVRVLLFAGLREKVGKGEMEFELDNASEVKDLQGKLNLTKDVWASMAFAVNQTYVRANTVLKEGDEVALIPPVAGG